MTSSRRRAQWARYCRRSGKTNSCQPEPGQVTQQPRTGHELLLNVRTALEHGLLIPESFYSDESLLPFFGAARIKWIRHPFYARNLDDFGALQDIVKVIAI